VTREPVTLDNAPLLDALRGALKGGSDREAIEVDRPELFTLDNGLRLIVQRSTAVPAAAIRVYWKGGLLADAPGRQGVANAAAEMLPRGTRRYSAAELAEKIDGPILWSNQHLEEGATEKLLITAPPPGAGTTGGTDSDLGEMIGARPIHLEVDGGVSPKTAPRTTT